MGLNRLYGVFKKEFRLQADSRLAFLNRLFVGPAISFVTTGILYHRFFGLHPTTSVAALAKENYLSFILFGFLVHTFLNTGYYSLATRLTSEHKEKTLPLFWLAPGSRLPVILGLCSIELMRSLIVTFFIFLFLTPMHGNPFKIFVLEGLALICLWVFSMALGILKAGFSLFNYLSAAWLDNLYLCFVFTSCLYIPKPLLPKVLQPICELNPAYQIAECMRNIWMGREGVLLHFALFFLGFSLLAGVILLCWDRFKITLVEKAI